MSDYCLTKDELELINARIEKYHCFDFDLRNIRVLGKNNKIIEVDLVNGKSSSGIVDCYYLKMLAWIFRNPDRAQYLIVSHFHKELRRGAINQALKVGKWLAYCRGFSGVKYYVQSVALEETRNYELVDFLMESKDWEECTIRFCKSRKKWELETFRRGRDYFYDECVKPTVTIEKKIERDDLLKYLDVIKTEEESLRLFAALCIYRYQNADNNEVVTWVMNEWGNALLMNLPRNVRRPINGFVGNKLNSWNNFETLLNMTFGEDYLQLRTDVIVDDEAEGIDYDFQNFPSYTYDSHTLQGKREVQNSLVKLELGKHDEIKVDMRWSGITLGEYWRCEAHRLHGANMLNKSWAEVIKVGNFERVLITEKKTAKTFKE